MRLMLIHNRTFAKSIPKTISLILFAYNIQSNHFSHNYHFLHDSYLNHIVESKELHCLTLFIVK